MSTSRGSGGGNVVPPIPAAARKMVQSLKEVVNRSEAEIYATLKDCDMDPDEAVSRLLSQDSFHEVQSKREKKKEVLTVQMVQSLKEVVNCSEAEIYATLKDCNMDPDEAVSRLLSQESEREKKKEELTVQMVQSLKEVVNCSVAEIYATLKDCNMDPDEAYSRLLSQDSFHEVKSKRKKKKEGKDTNQYRPRGANNSSTQAVKSGAEPYLGGSIPYYSSESAAMQGKHINKKKTEAAPYTSNLHSAPSISGNNNNRGTTGLSDDTSAENKVSSTSHSAWVGVPGQLSMADIVKMGRPHNKVLNAQNRSHNNDYNSRFSDNNASKVHDEWPSTAKPVGSHVHPFDSENQDYEAKEDEETVHDVESHSISSRKFPDDDSRGGSLYENDLYKNMDSSYLPQEHGFERHEVEEGGASVSLVTRNMEQLSVEKDERRLPSEGNDAVSLIPDHLKVQSADLSHLSFSNFRTGNSIPHSSGAITSLPIESNLEERHKEVDIRSVSHTDTRVSEYYDDDSFRNAVDGSLYRRPGSLRQDESSASLQEQLKPENDDEVQYPYTYQLFDTAAESELDNYFLSNIAPQMAAASAVGGTMSEAMKTPGLSSMQPAPRNLLGPIGTPVRQHLAVHPYSQAARPSGLYASMIGGYHDLPSDFQQTIANNSPYHRSLAAALPSRYTSSASRHGGLRNEGTISGNFPMNPHTALSRRNLNYEDVLSSQYTDSSQLISLQQNENSSTWPQGPNSRTTSAFPLDTYYNYLGQGPGQGPQPGGFRQSRQAYPNYYHSQHSMAQEQLQNPRSGSQDGSYGQPRQQYY